MPQHFGTVTISATGTAKPFKDTKLNVCYVAWSAKDSNGNNMYVGDSTVKNDGTDTNGLPGGMSDDFGPVFTNSINLNELYVNGTINQVLFWKAASN